MRNRRVARGQTLLEIMVATVVGSLLLTTVSLLTRQSIQHQRTHSPKLEINRSLDLALSKISNSLRQSKSGLAPNFQTIAANVPQHVGEDMATALVLDCPVFRDGTRSEAIQATSVKEDGKLLQARFDPAGFELSDPTTHLSFPGYPPVVLASDIETFQVSQERSAGHRVVQLQLKSKDKQGASSWSMARKVVVSW